MALRIVPLTLAQANALVASAHRHHKPCRGHRFSIGCEDDGRYCGAAIVGRPVARSVEQYRTAEVSRLVTDGTKNACSFLYSAAARVAREMGFSRIQTYILEDEPGTSLLAAGWTHDHTTDGGDWNSGAFTRKGRGVGKRRTDQPRGRKKRYVKVLND